MSTTTKPLSMTQMLVCGAAIVTLSMGIRHGFGLWLQPITIERGWNRETFAFALAVQNLAWGSPVRSPARSPTAGAPSASSSSAALLYARGPRDDGVWRRRARASSAAPAC